METIAAAQTIANPVLDAVALALTNLGAEEAYIVLLVIGYLAVDARAVRTLALALLISFYANQQLKAMFDTVRPYVDHPDLLRSEGAYETAPGPAFPSGHAQSASTFWGLAAMLGRRRWLTTVAAALILSIGATRVYLGVHWPIDVIGGIAIGLAIAFLALRIAHGGPRLGAIGQVGVWAALPLATHLAFPTPESGVIAGALAGFGTAPLLLRHRARGTVARRAGLAALGLVLAFAWLLGTNATVPETFTDHPLGTPLRYGLLAWIGLVGAPWLGARIGLLASAEEAEAPG